MMIQYDVPIPAAKEKTTRRNKYPFADMKVGGSVFFDDEPLGGGSKPARAAHAWARTNDAKFLTRACDGGVRIWRIS